MNKAIILDYDKADDKIKMRLVRFKDFDDRISNNLHQIVSAIRRGIIKNSRLYEGCLYERKNYHKSHSAFYFDRVKYQENRIKIDSENFKNDEMIGEILERLKNEHGAKSEVCRAIVNAGLAKNVECAYQVFYTHRTKAQVEFAYQYVKNKWGFENGTK